MVRVALCIYLSNNGSIPPDGVVYKTNYIKYLYLAVAVADDSQSGKEVFFITNIKNMCVALQ